MTTRNFWNVFKVGSGPSFQLDSTIPVPNENFPTPFVSTQVRAQLADGGDAFVEPEVKSIRESIQFIWVDLDKTARDQLIAYVTDGDIIKIVDNLGEEYIGKFVRMSPIWLVGLEDSYDIEGTFEIMPSPI